MPPLSKLGVHFPALSPFFHSLILCIDHDDLVPFVNHLLAAARGLLPEEEKEEKCPRGYKTGQEQPPPQALRFSQGRGERLVMSLKGPWEGYRRQMSPSRLPLRARERRLGTRQGQESD